MPIPALITGLLGLVGAGVGAAVTSKQIKHQEEVARQNLEMQQANLQWQKDQYAQMQEREDTAVSRRVDDLKESGLSPTLAAGSAAQAHQPVATTAPHREAVNYAQVIDIARSYMSLIQQRADVSRTSAETDRIREDIKTHIYDRMDRDRHYVLDRERVSQAAQQLGVNEQYLANDARRLQHDNVRINLEAQRVFNDSARARIDSNYYDLAVMMQELQRGMISEEIATERLRQIGFARDESMDIIREQQLVHDLTLSRILGLRSGEAMPGTIPAQAERQARMLMSGIEDLVTGQARNRVSGFTQQQIDELLRKVRSGGVGGGSRYQQQYSAH